jgi:thiamine biosynthesis lipoprotein
MNKSKGHFVFEKKLFGKEIEIIVSGDKEDEKKIEKAVESAYEEGLRLQKIFNFYDDESELSRLNKNRKINASQELLEIIVKAEVMRELTNGKYDVTLGRIIKERKEGKQIKNNILTNNLDSGSLKIKGNNIFLEKENVLVDLGSIAKGFITDRMGEVLKSKGVKEFVIDSRGDILYCGSRKHVVEVQHPREKAKILCRLLLSNEAVATSGDYNQYYGKFENSHIINSKDLISVTVVAKTLEEADLFATALFVSDEKTRKILLEENRDIKALTVGKDLKKTMYNGFGELIYGKQ